MDLSYSGTKKNYAEIESNVLTFFGLLKEVVPSIRIVRLDLPELTRTTFTTILCENFKRENVSDVIEFRVNVFKTVGSYGLFDNSILNQGYKITKHKYRAQPNSKIGYYFHPISKSDEETKIKRTKEIRLTIN